MRATGLDVTLRGAAERTGVPGVQAVLRGAGDVLWSGTYGWADVEAAVPVREDTLFCLASVGKLLLAALTLQCVEQSLLDLDTPVARFLGREIPGTEVVTVRMLLAHTAGYPDIYEAPEVAALMPPEQPDAATDYDPDRPFTWDMLAPGYREPREPGEHWAYSNAGYIVLTEVLVRLLGGPTELLATWTQLVAPEAGLGPDDGRLTPERSDWARLRLARGYRRTNDEAYADAYAARPPTGIPPDLYGLPFGDGLFAGTALGVAGFLDALFVRETFVGRSTLDQMTRTTAQAAADGPAEPGLDTYGLGTFRIPGPNGPWQGHSGTYGGFSAVAATRRDDGTTLVVLTNGMNDDTQPGRLVWQELAACTA